MSNTPSSTTKSFVKDDVAPVSHVTVLSSIPARTVGRSAPRTPSPSTLEGQATRVVGGQKTETGTVVWGPGLRRHGRHSTGSVDWVSLTPEFCLLDE